MAKFRIREVVIYEVEAETAEEAEDIIVNADDRDGLYFHSVEDREAYRCDGDDGDE